MVNTSKWIIGIAIGCGVVVLLLPILQAVLGVARESHETTALILMKAINTAESQMMSDTPDFGYVCTLAWVPGHFGVPSSEGDQMLEAVTTATESGYTFTITCGSKTLLNNHEHIGSYRLIAVPTKPGRTGVRGFCSDETGKIRFDPKGGTDCTEIIQ